MLVLAVAVSGTLAAGAGVEPRRAAGPYIPIAARPHHERFPAVARGAGTSLVVWQDERAAPQRGTDVYGQLVGPDGVPVDGVIAISRARGNQRQPAVAFNTSTGEYLVAWHDDRNGATRGSDIWAQRISSAGTVSGRPIRVTTAPGDQTRPDVAANPGDREFLIVWQDRRRETRDWDVYGQRVSADGARLGTNLRIGAGPGAQSDAAVAHSARHNQYLVAWADDLRMARRGIDVVAQRLAASGREAGPEIPVGRARNDQSAPDVAAGHQDGSFLVVWQDERRAPARRGDVFGQGIAPNGDLQGANRMIAATRADEGGAALAYDPTAEWYSVVWQTRSVSGGWDLMTTQLTPTGTPRREPYPAATAKDHQWWPAITCRDDASECLVFWGDLRNRSTRGEDITGRRVIQRSPRLDRVRIGLDGWLFNANTFKSTCRADLPEVAAVVDNTAILTSALEAAGKRAIVFVIPHKNIVYRGHLGQALDGHAECTRTAAESLHNQMLTASPPGYVDIWGVMVSNAGNPDPVYWRDDSHWSPAGAAVSTATLVDALQPGLWDPGRVRDRGMMTRVGDLTNVMGHAYQERYRSLIVNRPGVSVTTAPIYAGGKSVATRYLAYYPAGTEIIAGTTVLIADSYARYQADEFLAPYTDELIWAHWGRLVEQVRCCDFGLPWIRPAEQLLLHELVAADTVIVEAVEMRYWERFATPRLGMLTIDALAGVLPHHRLAAAADSVQITAADLDRHPGTPYLVVRSLSTSSFTVEVAPAGAGGPPLLTAGSFSETPVAVLDLSTAAGSGTLTATASRTVEFLLVWVD